MATEESSSNDIHLLKKTKISVFVDEALPDILVVSFEFGVKVFKGVLLDSTKKHIPCGIPNINPAFHAVAKTNPDDDALYSVNERFAYTDPARAKKRNIHISTKYKSNKMTVRLRPRQVLCSKCKGICSENSENVTKKRKLIQTPPIKRAANAPVTRSVNTELNKKKLEIKRTLIPKVSKEMPNALSGNVNKLNIDNNKKPLVITKANLNSCSAAVNNVCDSNNVVSKTDVITTHSLERSNSANNFITGPKLKRKRRSLDNMWDEELKEANKNNNVNSQSNANAAEQPLVSTRTIKICYGPQGEGTVLKIPAQLENLNVVDDDLEENIDIDIRDNHKAARKAMKKARKEAKRKSGQSSSPDRSPRYSIGGSSPRYTVGSASPRHGLGNNSPRYVMTTVESSTPKKRKHKMKHKKKHKEVKDRKHKDGEQGGNISPEESSTKEPCLAQKLSINLKRLSTSYSSLQNVDKTEESSSDEHCEKVPDFPPSNPPIMMVINASATVTSAKGADGDCVLVGDVVWGKIHGFPWWPGKILAITNSSSVGPQAHVAWYGSSTSSVLQCDQLSPYLDNFKTRYNKKKRGPYKEAIKQASSEAKEQAEKKFKESVVKSPVRNIISIVPAALTSPREINVIS